MYSKPQLLRNKLEGMIISGLVATHYRRLRLTREGILINDVINRLICFHLRGELSDTNNETDSTRVLWSVNVKGNKT